MLRSQVRILPGAHMRYVKPALIFTSGAIVGAILMVMWLDEELTVRDRRISGHEKEYRMMKEHINQLIVEPTREELDAAIAGLCAIIGNDFRKSSKR